MNPREETYIPGEPHYYSLRREKKCAVPETKGVRGWFRNHKPQALSLLNLIIVLPIVLFVYPFLMSQTEEGITKPLGPLQVFSRMAPGEAGTEWILSATGEPGDWEGHLEIQWSLGEERGSFSLYVYSGMFSQGQVELLREVLNAPAGSLLSVKCQWNGANADWTQILPPQN